MRKPLTSLMIASALALSAVVLPACTPCPTRESVGEYADDAAITARVKMRLLDNSTIQASAVHVETYRGVVQLSGFVDSLAMGERAVAEARQVPGVRGVRNDMRVKPPRS